MKNMKRIIAVVLCFVLAFSCSAVAFAAEADSEKYPVVFIPGFGQSETKVYDENGEYLGDVASFDLPELENISSIVKKLLSPLVLSAISRGDKELSKAVSDVMYDIFKPYALNDDGSSVYKREVRRFNAAYSELSQEDKDYIDGKVSLNRLDKAYDEIRYFYTYDSFGSIETAARELHEYIHNVVLAQTSADKIDIIPISQGGTVFAHYLDLYPEDWKYIRKVVNMIPAFDGSEIVGDIMTDAVTIYDIDALHEELLPVLLGEEETAYIISIVLRLALSTKTTEKVLRTALDCARDILVTKSSSMWALCPSDDYETAKNTYFGDGKYSEVYSETERYAQSRRNLPSNLSALMESGVIVHTIAFYDGKYIVGDLFESVENNCDGLLSVSSSTLGATAAKRGQTLGENYVSPHTYCNDETHNHISPDLVIDASTGYLPENTWYFKGAEHEKANRREDVKDFATQLIINDSITDIYSYPGFSQFVDPEERVAAVEISDDGIISYYDAEGKFMYSEKKPQEKEDTFTFWKVPYFMLNTCFRILHSLGLDA